MKIASYPFDYLAVPHLGHTLALAENCSIHFLQNTTPPTVAPLAEDVSDAPLCITGFNPFLLPEELETFFNTKISRTMAAANSTAKTPNPT
jgi:hypothetical protein